MKVPACSDRTISLRGNTYVLKCIHGRDMAPLVPLLIRTFGRRDFTVDWLNRKYACRVGELEGFSCVAFTDSGQPAASLGALPWPVRLRDRRELAVQLVDGATHSEHRRKGLFTNLVEAIREVCNSSNVSFLFGFAHTQGDSYPALLKLGFHHLPNSDLVEYRLRIRTLWAERLMRQSAVLHRLYEKCADRVLRTYGSAGSGFDNSLLLEGFAGTDRDQAFHSYKSALGGRVLVLGGSRVWIKISRGLLIGDLEAAREEEMGRAVEELKRLAARLGIQQIIFQASTGTRFAPFFARRFTPSPCLGVIYRNVRSQIPADKLRFTFGDLDNF